jgi:hypothetical protein
MAASIEFGPPDRRWKERTIPIAGEPGKYAWHRQRVAGGLIGSIDEQKGKHMKQKQIKSIHGLINAGGLVVAGIKAVGAELGLPAGTEESAVLELADLIMEHGKAEQASVKLKSDVAAQETAVDVALGFATQSRDSLKVKLGYTHSDIWVSVGYPNSLRVPTSLSCLIPLVETTRLFYTNNPTAEVPALNLTAAQAGIVLQNLTNARNAVIAQKSLLSGTRKMRRALAQSVQRRRRMTIDQLSYVLDPMHEYWMKFGLNRPGAEQIPDVPVNVTAVLVGNNEIAIKWDGAARAERYRVWKKVEGVDTEFVLVATRDDLDFILESLPANKKVEIAVSAVNNGGESALSEVIAITTLA